MDRLDVAAVQIARGAEHPVLLLARHLAGADLERIAHTRRELGGRLLGERDHDELVDGRLTGREHVGDPLHEHGRLAGAGAGLDPEVGVERADDPLARGLVAEPAHATLRISVARRASRSSFVLRSA